MWRFRDRERFIGGYDPEHEMPDPDRDPRDRWQSDAYRHNARDSRFFYRMDPDRVESRRYEGDYDRSWSQDRNYDRDRGYGDRGFRGDYGSDSGAGYGQRYGGGYPGRSDLDRNRGNLYGADRYDRDRRGYGYGPDRGWDHDRGFGFHERDRGYAGDRWDRDRDRGYDRGFDEDTNLRTQRTNGQRTTDQRTNGPTNRAVTPALPPASNIHPPKAGFMSSTEATRWYVNSLFQPWLQSSSPSAARSRSRPRSGPRRTHPKEDR